MTTSPLIDKYIIFINTDGKICRLAKKSDMKVSGSPAPLLALIPVKITNPIRNLVEKYCESHGAEYVKQGIDYTNRHITDKRKYRAFLEKTLADRY